MVVAAVGGRTAGDSLIAIAKWLRFWYYPDVGSDGIAQYCEHLSANPRGLYTRAKKTLASEVN